MINNRLIIKLMSKSHVLAYRWSRGLIGGRVGRARVLLLTTTGRKSGQPRSTPVLFLADGPDLIVVASNAGDARQPNWYLNLESEPHARVEVGGETRHVVARRATIAERDRLWPKLAEMYPTYDSYVALTRRQLPVVILQPAPDCARG